LTRCPITRIRCARVAIVTDHLNAGTTKGTALIIEGAEIPIVTRHHRLVDKRGEAITGGEVADLFSAGVPVITDHRSAHTPIDHAEIIQCAVIAIVTGDKPIRLDLVGTRPGFIITPIHRAWISVITVGDGPRTSTIKAEIDDGTEVPVITGEAIIVGPIVETARRQLLTAIGSAGVAVITWILDGDAHTFLTLTRVRAIGQRHTAIAIRKGAIVQARAAAGMTRIHRADIVIITFVLNAHARTVGAGILEGTQIAIITSGPVHGGGDVSANACRPITPIFGAGIIVCTLQNRTHTLSGLT